MQRQKTIGMQGKKRPVAARLVIQKPPTTEPNHSKQGRNTKPSDSLPKGQAAEGLDYRFLRSQPRVVGPGSLEPLRQIAIKEIRHIAPQATSKNLHNQRAMTYQLPKSGIPFGS